MTTKGALASQRERTVSKEDDFVTDSRWIRLGLGAGAFRAYEFMMAAGS